MHIKKFITGLVLVSSLVISNLDICSANTVMHKNISSYSIENQIDTLYDLVSKYTGLDKKYIKELQLLSKGKTEYIDTNANIYESETIKEYTEPMSLDGANTVYQKANFVKCNNTNIERPSKYYLPDALYSVAYDIKAIMSQRQYYNRFGAQEYFDSLTDTTKNNIIFYESVLLYTGEKEKTVNNMYNAYITIINNKNMNESVITENSDHAIEIKKKFKKILNDFGFKNGNTLRNLAIMLSFDDNLKNYNSADYITDTSTLPYIPNYNSRENMLIAQMSVVGKVRYVWGGGHSGASYVDGINPAWKDFERLYPDEPGQLGYGNCLKSKTGWCPIHNINAGGFHGETVYSLSDYMSIRDNVFKSVRTNEDAYKSILSQINFSHGVSAHSLDGLDCSGFASWLYNQVTDEYQFNSTAASFNNQSGVDKITFGDELLPGDVFAWTTHIVTVVGKVKDNSKAYVTVEQTPNVLKFGVIYYSGVSQNDIDLAKQIASEANELIGGINSELEQPHVYCMNTKGYYTVTKKINKKDNNKDTNDSKKDANDSKNNSSKLSDNMEDTNLSIQLTAVKLLSSNMEMENTESTETESTETESTETESTETESTETESTETESTEEESTTEEENIKNIENNSKDTEKNNNKKENNKKKKNSKHKEKAKDKEEKVIVLHKCNRSIGRMKIAFIDENTKVNNSKKSIENMTAQEIIQHILTKLPMSYITGYEKYSGKLFNKRDISSDLGITIKEN